MMPETANTEPHQVGESTIASSGYEPRRRRLRSAEVSINGVLGPITPLSGGVEFKSKSNGHDGKLEVVALKMVLPICPRHRYFIVFRQDIDMFRAPVRLDPEAGILQERVPLPFDLLGDVGSVLSLPVEE